MHGGLPTTPPGAPACRLSRGCQKRRHLQVGTNQASTKTELKTLEPRWNETMAFGPADVEEAEAGAGLAQMLATPFAMSEPALHGSFIARSCGIRMAQLHVPSAAA